MINAILIPNSEGIIFAQLITDEGKKIKKCIPTHLREMEQAKSAVQRMVDFENRDLIINTLTKWVKQQLFLSTNQEKINKLSYLLEDLNFYNTAGFHAVVKLVRFKSKVILSVAPPAGTRFYNHYQTKILPLLNFCNGKSGE